MSDTVNTPVEPAWFCLQCQPKHEHIAAAHLSKEAGFDVYLPRIRFKRSTRRGPVWFTEPLFPGYLFAQFELALNGRRARHARGVLTIVHFGDRWPSVPNQTIDELRAVVGSEEVHVVGDELVPGEKVQVAGGAFHGLTAVVLRVMPARERVAVLLDFLGRQTMAEIPTASVVRSRDERRALSEDFVPIRNTSTSPVDLPDER